MDPKHTKNYEIENFVDLYFEFTNVIQYGSEADIEDVIYHNTFLPSENRKAKDLVFYPAVGANAITMETLLAEAGLNMKKVMEKGALIMISFEYDCDMKKESCDADILFHLMTNGDDSPVEVYGIITNILLNSLFLDQLTYSVKDTGDVYRDFYKYQGLRVIMHTYGSGNTLSMDKIILQVSSALALLNIAIAICDIIMLYCPCLNKEHREMYGKYKIEDSEDFSNLQEKLDLIEKEQEKRLKKIQRERKKNKDEFISEE